MAANTETVRELIKRELPILIQDDPELQRLIVNLYREQFADKQQTEDRFDRILAEMQRDREEQARKWDEQKHEQNRKWDEQNRKWEEQNRKWDEQNRKWDEHRQTLEEQNRKWDEQNRKWEEQNRKWDKNQEALEQQWQETLKLIARVDRHLGAMGARWGIASESAFRSALASILEQSFSVQVLNINEFDDEGYVFGRPDQVELDVIIKNGLLILCELKSSISKADIHIFKRKTEFYQQKHKREANRLLVISPMIDKQAQRVAVQFGIEMFSDSLDVTDL